MSGTMWVLEFTGHSIDQAQDVVRQHTPVGEAVPVVHEEGRLGYEVVDSDYELICAVQAHVDASGGKTLVSRR